MRPVRPAKATALAVLTSSLLAGGLVTAAASGAQSATCADIDVVFARGTGEAPGLGIVGRPFAQSLTAELATSTVSSYAVDYAANSSQTSSIPGSADLVEHLQAVAAVCPSTRFVLGGYSQGATVVDKAVGVRTASSYGTQIPAALAGSVVAVVVYGNPIGTAGRTIASESTVYGPRSRDFCNDGDRVCDPDGSGWGAHLTYHTNGATQEGARFAAELVRRSGTPVPSPTPTRTASPTASPSPTSSSTPTPAPGTNPYERGPAPSTASIEASTGSFAVSRATVSSTSVRGFGGGTIYYPTTTTAGTFGAVAIAPGYTARQSSMAWLGPRLASQGFVVFTIDTLTTSDQPASRGDQLLAALDYLTTTSTVRTRVDATRLAVMGHSMGGGGTLEAAKDRPALKAAIPLTPWNIDKTWPEVRTPTLVIGAENDSTASVRSHAIPFYESLTNATERGYLELNGASHFAPNSSNTTIAKYSIAWLKRFVDSDTRYTQFICPGPGATSAVSDWRVSCPM